MQEDFKASAAKTLGHRAQPLQDAPKAVGRTPLNGFGSARSILEDEVEEAIPAPVTEARCGAGAASRKGCGQLLMDRGNQSTVEPSIVPRGHLACSAAFDSVELSR